MKTNLPHSCDMTSLLSLLFLLLSGCTSGNDSNNSVALTTPNNDKADNILKWKNLQQSDSIPNIKTKTDETSKTEHSDLNIDTSMMGVSPNIQAPKPQEIFLPYFLKKEILQYLDTYALKKLMQADLSIRNDGYYKPILKYLIDKGYCFVQEYPAPSEYENKFCRSFKKKPVQDQIKEDLKKLKLNQPIFTEYTRIKEPKYCSIYDKSEYIINEQTKQVDLSHVYSIKFGSCWDDKHIEKLYEGTIPDFSGVKKLILSCKSLTSQAIEILANTKTLENLTHLSLEDNFDRNAIGNKSLEFLANSEHLKNLTHLNFRFNNIQDKGLEILANLEHLKNLTHLNLRLNSIHNKGVIALANSEHLKNLIHLNLSTNWVSSNGAYILANSENMRNLKYLNLNHNHYIMNEGAEALANSSYLKNLRSLHLKLTCIRLKGAKALADSSTLNNVIYLDFRHNCLILPEEDRLVRDIVFDKLVTTKGAVL